MLCAEGAPIDKLILIKSGWIRRTRGVPFHATSPEVVMSMGEKIGVDFLGEGNCLGLEGVQQPAQWKYSATLMARTEVLELPIQSVDPLLRSELAATFAGFSNADDSLPFTLESVSDFNALKSAEEEIATGIIDGANLLVMDMDLCVRCGNCSWLVTRCTGSRASCVVGFKSNVQSRSANNDCNMLFFPRSACIAKILSV